jgi:PHP family Zn ribbon phosphoesterase
LCLQRLRQLHLPEHVFPPWKSLYPTDQDLKYALSKQHTHHTTTMKAGISHHVWWPG